MKSLFRLIALGVAVACSHTRNHGDRCGGLIYIDAAYDRTTIDSVAKVQPPAPEPRLTAADTVSLTSIMAVYERVMGVRQPLSEIRATVRFDSADRFLGEVTARVATRP